MAGRSSRSALLFLCPTASGPDDAPLRDPDPMSSARSALPGGDSAGCEISRPQIGVI
ncbi:hypothetical protein DESPIG_02245 [Desulfovibrio piger ATCC 29098]|uniref:Uncharacterized protein n=1 Tax=Desulfovibrio piger ATCC 29098 TaxID=411464 RepID=B6WVX7_9BACT|nr:hypothetical protein DESPIG_02245 [Desulfovibrio piger ATCC 29098]